jgi:hypothetical protein
MRGVVALVGELGLAWGTLSVIIALSYKLWTYEAIPVTQLIQAPQFSLQHGVGAQRRISLPSSLRRVDGPRLPWQVIAAGAALAIVAGALWGAVAPLG